MDISNTLWGRYNFSWSGIDRRQGKLCLTLLGLFSKTAVPYSIQPFQQPVWFLHICIYTWIVSLEPSGISLWFWLAFSKTKRFLVCLLANYIFGEMSSHMPCPFETGSVLVTVLLLCQNIMLKTTCKRKHLISGSWFQRAVESMTIMTGNMDASKQAGKVL